MLRERGVARSTYVFFTADNGHHVGERRLGAGKMTAYDDDIRVRLIAVGPRVPAGCSVDELAS